MIRCGIGYDAHRLAMGRKLVLGGVEVEWDRGLVGHSDADVLCHAIADALLGAAGIGELGELFPASDPRFHAASSLLFLTETALLLDARGFRIINIDSVLVADLPRLAPYRDRMRARVAEALRIDVSQVSIKPKSNEGLGFEGGAEGISARAVALVESDV